MGAMVPKKAVILVADSRAEEQRVRGTSSTVVSEGQGPKPIKRRPLTKRLGLVALGTLRWVEDD